VAEIRGLLNNLTDQQGVTVLLSSHILTEVARLATRIGIIDHGRLIRELHTRDLATQTRPRLSVATRDNAAAATVLRTEGFIPEHDGEGGLVLTDDRAVQHPDLIATLLVGAGCPPTRLAEVQDDLETYFLHLVSTGSR
jgi:ABC-2 type transport system ATP-binding protein